ncbi:non-ribosomal peptide synthetase [Streptomyces genisteinicus]|uniref:Amino acid adenylation domain-containing protein n=1 Tax=Streptomyces genisteinicus TaxID=2768068 RepID=A0A7H0I1G8_9ACTN|nr:non-ribosomal peptide synthetase [Streptomyces genisteinicus]QNP66634.1 amino acid adenylation domain-containing protein [Streptomyces genisteinicus]
MIPLSFGQRRLWFLQQLEGVGSAYNIPVCLRLRGGVDARALGLALGDVVGRHEVLRTVVEVVDGVPCQRVLGVGAVPVLSVRSCGVGELAGLVGEAVGWSFDLSVDVPVRGWLFDVGGGECVFVLVVHHIAADGWSLGPLLRDVASAYGVRCAGGVPVWGELPVQYADFALWQGELLGGVGDPGSLVSRQLGFWRGALAGVPEELVLPFDRARPVVGSFRGGSVGVDVGAGVHAGVVGVGRECGASVFMVLQAGLGVLLSRLGAGSDVPLGCPVAGRSEEGLEDLVGFFVNTLVMRVDVSGDPSFRELVGRVREVNLGALAHQDVPFDLLVEELNPPRSAARNPLFQVMFTLQNGIASTVRFPGLEVSAEDAGVRPAKFDLTFALEEEFGPAGEPAGIKGVIDYNADLFDEGTVRRIAGMFPRVLRQLADRPDAPVGRLTVNGPEEDRLLEHWSGGPAGPSRTAATTLVDAFQEQVRRTPDAVAVGCGAHRLTYRQLNARANRLARHLRTLGAGPERMVAVALPRSTELVAALLAVLKTGAAYVPVDTAYPERRIAHVLRDADALVLVTTSEAARGLPGQAVPRLPLDSEETRAALDAHPGTDLRDDERTSPLLPDHPAYTIHTSGSTGTPKGVVVTHRNVLRLFASTRRWFSFGEADVWTLFHSFAFDFSVWELWGPLLHGGRLVVVPYETSRSPRELLRLLADERVTVLNQTPSAFHQLMRADAEHPETGRRLALRYVVFGGEALDPGRLADWYTRHAADAPRLVNMYGITETTVHVTALPLERGHTAEGRRSPIGSGIADLRVHVLDERLRRAPIGVAGELYVSGPGLARGYLNRPALTAGRFVADPYGPPGGRMYRTGDIVRWRSAGGLEYLGRADDQIKLRGFRIEPAEVEAALLDCDRVEQAAVVLREDRQGDRRLVAYATGPEPGPEAEAELRRQAGLRLPGHMVPSACVVLPALPLTENGKLDRKALPAPRADAAGPVGRAARDAGEQRLCDLFAEVLGLPEVGPEQGFFELGGHSLLAVRLIERVRAVLGAEIGIGTLFTAPTPAAVARRLRETGAGPADDSLGPLLALRADGARAPVFCVHPAAGTSWVYAGLLAHLDGGQPVYGLQSPGLTPGGRVAGTFDELVTDYLRTMRQAQAHGPYHLLGWSFGGMVAHAMATRLQQEGEKVALLALLDAYPGEGRGGVLPAEGDVRTALFESLGRREDGHGATGAPGAALADVFGQQYRALRELGDDPLATVTRTFTDHCRLAGGFRPGRFEGDALVFAATWEDHDGAATRDPRDWRRHVTGRVEVHRLPCGHGEMTSPAALARIGPVLAARLDDATGAGALDATGTTTTHGGLR